MKKHLNKTSIWLSFLSLTVSSIFILIATSTSGLVTDFNVLMEGVTMMLLYHKDDVTPGVEAGTYTYSEKYLSGTKTINGRYDGMGRWHGLTTFTYRSNNINEYDFIEEVPMIHGKRHGISTITMLKDNSFRYNCYNMDQKVDCDDFILKKSKEISAFEILTDKYPWHHSSLNVLGFEDDAIQMFMDTLETVINSYVFTIDDFDYYYSDAIEVLEDTPHDSIISYNSKLCYSLGINEIKNYELRQAVIDRYRSGSSNTYDVVTSTYPNYLLDLNEAGVTHENFELFCQDLDDTLALFDLPDPEDPFYLDSIDAQLFFALLSIYSAESNSLVEKLLLGNEASILKLGGQESVYHKIKSILQPSSTTLTSAEVAEIVIYSIFMLYDQGNILKKTVRESYRLNMGIARAPIVTTALSEEYSDKNTILAGYIIDDGGAAITEKGIAWAEFYNPCIEDNKVNPESSTNDFIITFTGLTEGTSYFARTYAVNSAGIAYGNCVCFVPGSADAPENIIHVTENYDFSIYPNPTSDFATLCIQNEKGAELILSVLNHKGQVVLMNNLGRSLQDDNKFHMDLSHIPEGLYICHLKINNSIIIAKKIMIIH
jgi:hypothetical protein